MMMLLVQIYLSVQDDSTEYDTGILSSFNLQYFDFTVRSDETDKLNLFLYVGKSNDTFHIYPINKSLSVLSDSAFRKDLKTALFVHGFINGTTELLTNTIITAYSRVGGYNIMLLDVNPYTWISYLRAARVSRDVGNRLGLVLYRLSRRGLNISNFTLIGHSLGAHIVGFAGRAYRKKSGKKLPFIVGLDPAGPCFRRATNSQRLARGDAEFVEVIHTNGVGFGLMNAIGKVDFYFNGGRFQSGYVGAKCGAFCSHLQAVSVWSAAVLNSHKFIGLQCNSLVEMDKGYCYGGRRNTAFLGHDTRRNASGARKWYGFNYGLF